MFKLQQLLLVVLTCIIISTQYSCKTETPTPTDPLPNAGFTYTSARVFPAQVSFVNTSTGTLPIVSSIWDFGDGSTSTVSNPLHAYANAGTYLVRLVQRYSNTTSDTITVAVALNATGPSGVSSKADATAAASFTFTIPAVYLATFTNTSTNASNYLWDFGDAASSTSAATAVTHQYNAAGPFAVKLRANGSGGTDTCSAQIVF